MNRRNLDIIETKMIKNIQKFYDPIFHPQNLQMIKSNPVKKHHFFKYRSICKGRFSCSRCHKQWSSSLVNTITYFKCYPQNLEDFIKYEEKNQKCEIYFYLRVYGQRCQKCKSRNYEYPDIKRDDQGMVAQNFANFIYNNIMGKPKKQEKNSKYPELKNHIEYLCQACQLGLCKKMGKPKEEQFEKKLIRNKQPRIKYVERPASNIQIDRLYR